MIKACDVSKSTVVKMNAAPHIVEQIQVQTPSARGAATLYKIRFRNMQTGGKVDKSYRGDDMLEDIEVERREVQYLYHDGDDYAFMDLGDYSQFTLKASEIEEEVPYLIDNLEGIQALVSEDRVVGLDLPPVVEMEVVECDPSIRGASVTNRTKPAKVSTGLIVQVPEYLASGERIRVDTRSGKFVSRA